MTKDTEHLFGCLFAICIPCLVKKEEMAENDLLNGLPVFKKWVIFLLSCKSSLHILDISPLSDMYFTNISSSLKLVFSFFGQYLCRAEAMDFD